MYSAPESTVAFEETEVSFHIRRFKMLLGITGNPDAKFCFYNTLEILFQVNTIVHTGHLFHQVNRVAVTAGFRLEKCFILRCITTNNKKVIYSKKIQVYQSIFGFIFG